MKTKTFGTGQVYSSTKLDNAGNVLKGGETYRHRVPANAPAEQLWVVTMCAEHTRQFVIIERRNANLDSRNNKMKRNACGSVDIYFGPDATRVPVEMKNNWIQTNSGEGWFPYFRLYAPKKAFFDKTWTMGDIESVEK